MAFKHIPPTSDTLLINTMMYVCRVLHDSLDNLSSESERTKVASLLLAFVDKLDFGRDVEQQLTYYTECRASFCNIDGIQIVLVMNVCGLALKVAALTRGKLNKKTSVFAKSCLAYCHITIPSIKNLFKRLDLLLLCAQVRKTLFPFG